MSYYDLLLTVAEKARTHGHSDLPKATQLGGDRVESLFSLHTLLHHAVCLLHWETSTDQLWACGRGGCLCEKRSIVMSINPGISLLFSLKL